MTAAPAARRRASAILVAAAAAHRLPSRIFTSSKEANELMAMTDAPWAALAPFVEACRPRSKRPPQDLRRELAGILWRHRNGAAWHAVPAQYGPLGSLPRLRPGGTDDRRRRSWWRSAQLFIRWSRLGAWQRLLGLAPARGVELGWALLDGPVIRARHKAAGARKRGARGRAVASVAPDKAHERPLATRRLARGRGCRSLGCGWQPPLQGRFGRRPMGGKGQLCFLNRAGFAGGSNP